MMTGDADLGLDRFTPPTLQEIHDAFVKETRGDGAKILDDDRGVMVLDTVQGVEVHVFRDTWSYYGTIWNAELHVPAQFFKAPLLEGPAVDADQPPADALLEAVEWLRKITDSTPDRD